MIFFAHIGSSAWLAHRLAPRLSPDARWNFKALLVVCLFALLPDLVDKPVFYLGLAPAHTGRVWGHTLLFSLVCCLACRWWLKPLWPWALATPGHLVLDSMWERPHTLAWPVLGNIFDEPEMYFPSHWHHWVWLYHNDPLILAGLVAADLAGLALLATAAWPLLRLAAKSRGGGPMPPPLSQAGKLG